MSINRDELLKEIWALIASADVNTHYGIDASWNISFGEIPGHKIFHNIEYYMNMKKATADLRDEVVTATRIDFVYFMESLNLNRKISIIEHKSDGCLTKSGKIVKSTRIDCYNPTTLPCMMGRIVSHLKLVPIIRRVLNTCKDGDMVILRCTSWGTEEGAEGMRYHRLLTGVDVSFEKDVTDDEIIHTTAGLKFSDGMSIIKVKNNIDPHTGTGGVERTEIYRFDKWS